MAKGRIDVNGKTFNTGDAARIRDGGKLSFTNGDNAEILILICVRKKFQPCHNQQNTCEIYAGVFMFIKRKIMNGLPSVPFQC